MSDRAPRLRRRPVWMRDCIVGDDYVDALQVRRGRRAPEGPRLAPIDGPTWEVAAVLERVDRGGEPYFKVDWGPAWPDAERFTTGCSAPCPACRAARLTRRRTEHAENVGLYNILRYYERQHDFPRVSLMLDAPVDEQRVVLGAAVLRSQIVSFFPEHLKPRSSTQDSVSRRMSFRFTLPDPHPFVLRDVFSPFTPSRRFTACGVLTRIKFHAAFAALDGELSRVTPLWHRQQRATGEVATVDPEAVVKFDIRPVFTSTASHADCARCAAFASGTLPPPEHTELIVQLPVYFELFVSFKVRFFNYEGAADH